MFIIVMSKCFVCKIRGQVCKVEQEFEECLVTE